MNTAKQLILKQMIIHKKMHLTNQYIASFNLIVYFAA